MKTTRKDWITFFIGLAFGWIALACLMFNKQVQYIVQEKIIGIEYCENFGFSQENLINEIKRLDFKFPHIVLAQAQLETGDFTSKVFQVNHNLFGMKEAKARINLAVGTKNGHAEFATWSESLLDYGLYQCRFIGKISSEKEYYNYLAENYAEDSLYVGKVKKLAQQNKKFFN